MNFISTIGADNSECDLIDKSQNDNGNLTSSSHNTDDGLEEYLKAEESLDTQVNSTESSHLSKQMEQNLFKNLLISYNAAQRRISRKNEIFDFWKSMENDFSQLRSLAEQVLSVLFLSTFQ